ncbi:MAG TPA: MATE family efflux transporter, partial [Firmicutes bacterium]|nr:MATE family efflux transporter [Bacillota bacterium]
MTDMTKGNPIKLILAFMVPILIGNLFQQVYNMVDTAIVGQFVGVEALAAVGSTGGITFLVVGFIIGFTHGFSVIISQLYGSNDEEGIKKAVGMSLLLSIAATIVITILTVLLVTPILKLMNTPSDIIEYSASYIRILFLGTAATVAYNLFASILRALGDSKTPLYFLIIASVLNIVLDLVFIINFNMGVSGAALATVISQSISAILCYIYIKKKTNVLTLEKHHYKIDKVLIRELLFISIPMALQYSITAIGVMIVQVAINGFGSTTVAAYTAATKAEQVVMQPSIAIGLTLATYVGQNLGAKKYDRIKDGVKKGLYMTVIYNILSAIFIMTFGKHIIGLFVAEGATDVMDIALTYISISAFFYPVLGVLFLYRYSLQGLGNAKIPMYSGIVELGMRCAIAFTLPAVIGFYGICVASPAAW